MFEEIGHHVEKIKRVRYGPLELDVHPGKFRRLTRGEQIAGAQFASKLDVGKNETERSRSPKSGFPMARARKPRSST